MRWGVFADNIKRTAQFKYSSNFLKVSFNSQHLQSTLKFSFFIFCHNSENLSRENVRILSQISLDEGDIWQVWCWKMKLIFVLLEALSAGDEDWTLNNQLPGWSARENIIIIMFIITVIWCGNNNAGSGSVLVSDHPGCYSHCALRGSQVVCSLQSCVWNWGNWKVFPFGSKFSILQLSQSKSESKVQFQSPIPKSKSRVQI